MPGTSGNRINYTLRPAKTVERKMMADLFQRLNVFDDIRTAYSYIGFGSFYFSDFFIFHRKLGIRQMTSIENDESSPQRFEFNKPFECIQIKFGESSSVLKELSFAHKALIWLDYDGRLNESVLEDVAHICALAVPGTVLVVSVNAMKPSLSEEDKAKSTSFAQKLAKEVGESKIPLGLQNKNFAGWGSAKVYRQILNNEIEHALLERNGGINDVSPLMYKQLLNFHYEDDAMMLTVGGIIIDENQEELFQACRFADFEYFCPGDDPFKIDVPKLTHAEVRYLNRQLPRAAGTALRAEGIPKDFVRQFEKIYRYFPSFAEMEF